MKHIKTMAILITPKTYPIAVACLAGGFAALPPESVFNHVLVINDVCAEKIEGRGLVPDLTNCWMSIDDFVDWYIADGSLTDIKFKEADRIR